ncbi:uncharacterized protein LOC109579906 [Bactrocera dorsalis]|uniref:Uncharacterized protein LOC109579906 n=1 Tax=Bactrocera dorsalis TaxID=27457 RepID=A0ABM3K8A6_BACDO|nr:uncharacterized protein LOC109579906 [Bactrocera dorsalis]XP_049317726.1 uncharacterized protein LOC109579906 [Bactrocera dorsalis]
MSTKLPIISVTTNDHSESECSEDSHSNDMDYNFNTGEVTDVEDFDSQTDMKILPTRKASNHTLNIPKQNEKDNDATDIEDYNDTDSEDDEEEKSNVYPELKLSLQEFLEHGLREQSMVDNEAKEKVENKAGDFLQAQNLNQTSDFLTDCEDYNTESELDNGCERSVCVDLDIAVGEQGRVFIADSERSVNENEHSDEYEDLSVISDISELASALSDVAGPGGARGMSEDEVLEMSGDEEECQIVISESASDEDDQIYGDNASNTSLPPIDVAFISSGSQQRRKSTTMSLNKNAFLTVANTGVEEVLTDVEKLDDSAAEDSFDSEEEQKSIPRAVILRAAGEDSGDITDVEDVFCDDVGTQSSNEPNAISDTMLPPVHREMVVLKEDKFGDTIENVMPLDREYQFGVYNSATDGMQTDDEDYSCADDLERNGSIAECLNAENLIEDEVTVLNETLKPQVSKRLELHALTEPVTDIEEIYVDGTNRRKKLKTRSLSKGKSKLLDVVRVKQDGGTDVEDMDLSDRDLPPNIKLNAAQKQHQDDSIDKATDIEDISADERSDISDNEAQCDTDIGSSTLKAYIANNSNIVLTIETDGQRKSHINHLQTLTMSADSTVDATNLPNTDIEDMQCTSDADDVDSDKVADDMPTCNCTEFNELLNESYTVVHEKNTNSFNAEAEKLHMKGNVETLDAHTDIEYVESDESAAKGGN